MAAGTAAHHILPDCSGAVRIRRRYLAADSENTHDIAAEEVAGVARLDVSQGAEAEDTIAVRRQIAVGRTALDCVVLEAGMIVGRKCLLVGFRIDLGAPRRRCAVHTVAVHYRRPHNQQVGFARAGLVAVDIDWQRIDCRYLVVHHCRRQVHLAALEVAVARNAEAVIHTGLVQD